MRLVLFMNEIEKEEDKFPKCTKWTLIDGSIKNFRGLPNVSDRSPICCVLNIVVVIVIIILRYVITVISIHSYSQ